MQTVEIPMTYMEMYLRLSGMDQSTLALKANVPQPKISVMSMKGEKVVSSNALMRVKKALAFPGEPEQLLERIRVEDNLLNVNTNTKD